ncbi:MAG TPA: hypothetical protein DIU09_13455 [Hyphomonadaceae bacterium]|nr:hypothetical protein AEM38_07200 [Hyphomonadaceae bacterium UKL13-1]HCP65583.1 hypothetical protein [Hyphomonadaceae bacterium]
MADMPLHMNLSVAKPLLLPLALAGLFITPAQAQSVPKDYRDWSVSCSNIKTCTAISISGLNEMGIGTRPRGVAVDTEMGWLWVELEAGPSAKPKIIYSGLYDASQTSNKEGSLRIVGRDGRPLANGVFVLTAHESGASQLRGADVDRFIAVAKSGQAIVYSSGTSRTVQSFASLSGFVAALRAIEALQGRTGTVAAWVDVGKLARERVPPAPAAPRVNALGFTKLSSRTTVPKLVSDRRKAECDDSDRLDPGGQGIEGFNLGKGRTLWAIPCGAGAYNMWSKFYLQTNSTKLEPYRFSTPEPAADEEDANSLVNVSIEPETGQISAFSKGRGIGDCGSAQTYTWDGTNFVLTSLIEMNACSGLMPDFWPVRIKTEVVAPIKSKR